LTALQCTPIGEGAAAVIVASDEHLTFWHQPRSYRSCDGLCGAK
jgi:hypothetical protein